MIEGLRTRFYAEEDLTPRNLYFVLYVIERARVFLIVGSIEDSRRTREGS